MHDDDLRRRLRELADQASPRPGSEAPVVKRAGLRRRLTAAGAGLVLVAFVAGLAGATTMLGRGDPLDAAPGPRETEAESAYVDDEDGVSVVVPPGWQVAEGSLTPKLADPREILSLGTAPLLAGGKRCQNQPENALEAMTSVDAFVSIQERAGDGEAYPPRSKAFEDLEASPDQFEVCGKPPYVETYWIPFSDEGRNFYLLGAVGDGSDARREEMLRVIESLDFAPTEEESISACEGMEPPSTAVEYGLPLQPSSEGSNEVVPIVFPDGTTAELVYPAELSSDALTVPFDELRARPDPAGGPPGNMIRPQIVYGGVPEQYGIEGIVDCHQGPDGEPVPVWSSKDGDLIVRRFGKWHVVVFNRRSNLEAWARHLEGEVLDGGWLVLRGGSELPIGPENDPGDAPLLLYARDRIINLWPLDCAKRHKNEEPELSKVGRQSFVSYCLEDVQIEVHVQGPQEFVEAIFNGLQVRNVNRVHPLNKYALFP